MVEYCGIFTRWIRKDDVGPYNSWGNGSAMYVTAAGFAFEIIEETLRAAQISAEVTHNHPEGIKGAQATAAIFLARTCKSKEEIRTYITKNFGYKLNYTGEDIRLDYRFEESCQETVPQTLVALLDSKDHENAIRLTISLGGDVDTMGAITGAIAAAYYKAIPDELVKFTLDKLPQDLKDNVLEFEEKYNY